MLLGAGRIAGVSGILARGTAIAEGSRARTSAWGFLVGLPLSAMAIRFGTDWEPAVFAPWPVRVRAALPVASEVCRVGTQGVTIFRFRWSASLYHNKMKNTLIIKNL